MHDVVITGIGVISALGNNTNSFWQSLIAGKCGIAQITQLDCLNLRFKHGAEVKSYLPQEHFDENKLRYLDRFAQFASIATTEAVNDAKLTAKDLANSKTGVITGSSLGGKISEDAGFYRLYHDKKSIDPALIINAMSNAAASYITTQYGITGPAYNISSACASSAYAIGQAFWLIKNGIINRAIVGGSEAPFSFGHLKAWEAMRIISPNVCQPFSKYRNGLSLGEGAAILILENRNCAKIRNAKIYAEVCGFGMSSDAHHITNPDSHGQQQAIYAALKDAKLSPNFIDYINAHGTGTIINDKIEAKTINNVFTLNKKILISSTKASHGHLLGAASALESVVTILAVKNNLAPPIINFTESCDDCSLPLVINQAIELPIKYAINLSFAFGGLNTCLIFKK